MTEPVHRGSGQLYAHTHQQESPDTGLKHLDIVKSVQPRNPAVDMTKALVREGT